jgi:cysteine desulfurase
MQRNYLDHAATSPLRPQAEEALVQALRTLPGNPSSPHREGREGRRALEEARASVARILGVGPGQVLFTRGGTESVNMALAGVVRSRGSSEEAPGPLVHSVLEHSAVQGAAEALASMPGGPPLERLRVHPDGSVDAPRLEALLQGDALPVLLSIQSVNSETGVTPGLRPILEATAARGVPVHVDASQGALSLPGREPSSEGHPFPPLLTLSGHKFGGPRGVGLLVRDPDLALSPLLHGGSQEGGLRPGTEDVAGAVALAAALAEALADPAAERLRLTRLRERLESGLLAAVAGLEVVGNEAPRAPHILMVGLEGLPRDLLPGVADRVGLAASAGSACRSGSQAPSPALEALLGTRAHQVAPLRLSLGWSSTEADVEAALERLPPALLRARQVLAGVSP